MHSSDSTAPATFDIFTCDSTCTTQTSTDLPFKAIVQRKNRVEASKLDALYRSNGSASASETWNMSEDVSGSAMQTDTAGCCNDCAVQTEYDNDRYVITNYSR